MTVTKTYLIVLSLLCVFVITLTGCSSPHPPKTNEDVTLPSDQVNRERDPLKPRVPAHLRGAVRNVHSPLYVSSRVASPEIIVQGKRLYDGKGTCFNCHGWSGDGDDPAAQMVDPGPRDFTNCQFHNQRADGELFWVIQHGSPDTDMVGMVPTPLTEEEAWKVLAYVRTFCHTWTK